MSELLARKEKMALPFDLLSFALEPSDRAVLHERIARRFDIMLEETPDGNLITEVETLRRRGDLHPGLPSMRCVGYRQAWEYLDGVIDYQTMRETGIIATRQLAKRQLTWLRSMPDRVVLDCLAPDPAGAMLARIADQLG
jgi:tRNA dimethylallyltransferase